MWVTVLLFGLLPRNSACGYSVCCLRIAVARGRHCFGNCVGCSDGEQQWSSWAIQKLLLPKCSHWTPLSRGNQKAAAGKHCEVSGWRCDADFRRTGGHVKNMRPGQSQKTGVRPSTSILRWKIIHLLSILWCTFEVYNIMIVCVCIIYTFSYEAD